MVQFPPHSGSILVMMLRTVAVLVALIVVNTGSARRPDVDDRSSVPVSSVPARADQCTMPLHPGQRTALFDITNVSAADVGACCIACQSTPACRYFEYETKTSPPRCWLKTSGKGPKTHDPTCTSGGITPTPGACVSDDDCSLCGTCSSSTHMCVCDRGFTGPNCELLNLASPQPCGSGGLCMHGERVGSNSGVNATTAVATWGGSVVSSPDFTSFHMYASMFQMNASLMGNNGSASWITNSDVVHAVASTPGGPYTPADIALGPRGRVFRDPNCSYQPGIPATVCPVVQADDFWDAVTAHTPAAQRDPTSGKYLLYYMGTRQNRTNAKNGFPCLSNDNPPLPSDKAGGPDCQQRVGLAVADDPAGPWLRWDANGAHASTEQSTYILPPGKIGDFDSGFTNNPTPLVLKNGSVVLIYKGRAAQCPGCGAMRTGVATADTWKGPYVKQTSRTPMSVPQNCEDAAVYVSPLGYYRVIFHCGCNYLIAVSRDGVTYTAIGDPKPWCNVTYTDGSTEVLKRRERPQWVMGKDGLPTHLMTGVLGTTSHYGLVWTMAAQLL